MKPTRTLPPRPAPRQPRARHLLQLARQRAAVEDTDDAPISDEMKRGNEFNSLIRRLHVELNLLFRWGTSVAAFKPPESQHADPDGGAE